MVKKATSVLIQLSQDGSFSREPEKCTSLRAYKLAMSQNQAECIGQCHQADAFFRLFDNTLVV